jgi:hypothetical protein
MMIPSDLKEIHKIEAMEMGHDPKKLTFPGTREALFAALGAVIEAAPQAEQDRLAQALEDFASHRGERSYRRICRVSPVMRELMDTIEEASGAYLFLEEQIG